MTTLQIVTDFSRKVLAIAAMITIGGLLIYFGIKIGFAIKEAINPTPPPPPTVSYGKLPPIIFPDSADVTGVSYSVNTVTGDYPDFGDRARIYRIGTQSPSLLALQNATQQLLAAGFASTPQAVSDVLYSWTNSDPLPKTLTYNIQTHDFTMTSNYLHDATVQAATNVPDQPTATGLVTSFLTSIGSQPADIDGNKTKVTLWAISEGQLIPATSLSTAQVVRVDLFQHDVNKLPIYYSQPSYSSMNVLLGSADTNPQLLAANFYHQSISSDYATYPIKTAQGAFKELQAGKAYIASSGTKQVTIRSIVLGYFMSDKPQDYLMPIIIFQGDNNFFAYVSAVTDSWIQPAN